MKRVDLSTLPPANMGDDYRWRWVSDQFRRIAQASRRADDTAAAPASAGTGDVVGPASATANNPAVFNGATGKLIKEITYAAFKAALGLVKGDVGLGSVDNTSDLAKPVSTATQTALDLKADLASPALTGAPTAPTPDEDDDSTAIATTEWVNAAIDAAINDPITEADTADLWDAVEGGNQAGSESPWTAVLAAAPSRGAAAFPLGGWGL